MTKRVPHPISMIFPMMDDAEIEELASDIVLHGLREPIWVHRDGSILDGRNRYEACYRAEVPCKALTFEGEDRDLLSFSLSMNLHRRHMTISQRAAVAANIANLEHGTNRFADKIEGSIDPSTKTAAISSAYAAEAMGVGEKSVDKARKVKSEDPELFGKIQEGKVSVNKAYNSLSKKPEKDTAKPRRSQSQGQPRPLQSPTISGNSSHGWPLAPVSWTPSARVRTWPRRSRRMPYRSIGFTWTQFAASSTAWWPG